LLRYNENRCWLIAHYDSINLSNTALILTKYGK